MTPFTPLAVRKKMSQSSTHQHLSVMSPLPTSQRRSNHAFMRGIILLSSLLALHIWFT